MDKSEIKKLAEYVDKVHEETPRGLSALKWVLSMVCLDLNAFAYQNIKLSEFQKSLDYANSIPVVTDLNDDKLTDWMLHNHDYINHPSHC